MEITSVTSTVSPSKFTVAVMVCSPNLKSDSGWFLEIGLPSKENSTEEISIFFGLIRATSSVLSMLIVLFSVLVFIDKLFFRVFLTL